ncbi:MAG: DUF4876 domain-containing protein [Prevotella sp.]|nr:DUF4876 domain-containing protein [Prevotella sp.]MBR1463320.1 DUF4876 domain-containing protein [Prevotella sp.]
MKRHLIYIIGIMLTLCSCVDYNDATQAISVKVQVVMPDEFVNAPQLGGHEITMTLGGEQLKATTDANGVATFENIVPDIYDITTTWKITSEEYMAMTGKQVQNNNYTISGSINSQLLKEDSNVPLQLKTQAAIVQSILISKIYSSGSKDNNKKNYQNGKYIELYNNSDEDEDIAGLYIGLLESTSTPAYLLGQTPDIIYMKQVFRIPADKPCIVKPGETVVIVNSAIDHSQYGPMEQNLLDADFEAKDTRGRTENNPDTPALELIYTYAAALSYMNLVQGGPCSIVIFRTEDNVADYQLVYPYGKTKGSLFMAVPTKYVVDGVDFLVNKAQTGVDISTKRLYDYIDSGNTNINATSGNNGEVVYRKIQSITDDGRIILQDTNNSSSDFGVSDAIHVREFK